MDCAAQLGKVYGRYVILLLLCLLLLVGLHVDKKAEGVVITRKAFSVVSKRTIQVLRLGSRQILIRQESTD